MTPAFKNIQAVIFDLDGTLINSIEDIAQANNKMLKEYGHPTYNTDKYIDWIGKGLPNLVRQSLFEVGQPNEKSFKQMVARTAQCYTEIYADKTYIYQGMQQVLDFLKQKNIPFNILTNKPHDITLKVVEALFPNETFQMVLGQSERFPKKPAPNAALYIAGKLKVKPNQVLFIGDSQVDVNTANNAGMPVIGVTWGYAQPNIKNHPQPAAIVDSPGGIIDLLY